MAKLITVQRETLWGIYRLLREIKDQNYPHRDQIEQGKQIDYDSHLNAKKVDESLERMRNLLGIKEHNVPTCPDGGVVK